MKKIINVGFASANEKETPQIIGVMSNLLKNILACVVLVAMASCSETRLRYLGYTYLGGDNPAIDYEYWGKAPSSMINTGPMHKSASDDYFDGNTLHDAYENPWAFHVRYGSGSANNHSHYLLRDYRYAVFCPEGYVSENDVEDFKGVMQTLTKRTLNRMLASMHKNVFVTGLMDEKYSALLSKGVKEKMKAVSDGSLGGWQMLKPTVGLDTSAVFYRVQYRGGDWYDIFAPQCNDTVSVKVEYAGKFLNPVIVGLRNDRMGVNVLSADYDSKLNSKMLAFNHYDQEYMYLEFLCPLLHKRASSGKLIADEDFDKLKAEANTLKLAFVEEFYRYILDSGNDMRKIQKKYRYSMAQRFAGMTDTRVHNRDYSTDMFLPCSYSDFAAGNHTVTYLGDDWYQVSAAGKSLTLKVVLYGKRLTPAIMGMRNPNQNISYCSGRFTWLDGNK